MLRIVYATDIHDSLKELRVLLSETRADLYLLSGDILYYAFTDEAKVFEFVSLQEEFYGMARGQGRSILPYDLATEILRATDAPADLTQKAVDYRILFHRAARTMKGKYSLIEDLILKYGGADCYLLPGNYDIDLRYTALAARNLHKHCVEVRGLRLAGYGGAPIATSGIPEKLAVPYQETGTGSSFYSEPQEFFSDSLPDILLLHNPAYGYFDRIPRIGHVGSHGIRNYLDDHPARLVFSGHIHEDPGIMRKRDGTILLNPSNFGGVDSPYGYQAGGMFLEVLIDEASRSVASIHLRRLLGPRILDILHIRCERDGLISERGKDVNSCPIDLDSFLRDHAGMAVQS